MAAVCFLYCTRFVLSVALCLTYGRAAIQFENCIFVGTGDSNTAKVTLSANDPTIIGTVV